jgi:hypothetical protein
VVVCMMHTHTHTHTQHTHKHTHTHAGTHTYTHTQRHEERDAHGARKMFACTRTDMDKITNVLPLLLQQMHAQVMEAEERLRNLVTRHTVDRNTAPLNPAPPPAVSDLMMSIFSYQVSPFFRSFLPILPLSLNRRSAPLFCV